ncbi:acetoacetyl-CoA synthetase-like [Sesbania bispinosa]|nr:acetoacetyl-CoA synthetase-like [Sesbania bispinosa]
MPSRRTLEIAQEQKDVSASSLNEPGFGIVSMKPLPVKPSEPWPDQDRVKVMKALTGACSVIGLWTFS